MTVPDPNVRSVLRIYLKERLNEGFFSDQPTEKLFELESLSSSLLDHVTTWRNEQRQREKMRAAIRQYFVERLSEMPPELRIEPVFALLGALTPVAIESPYRAILARAGRRFAQDSILAVLVLMLDLPLWISDKLDKGELTFGPQT